MRDCINRFVTQYDLLNASPTGISSSAGSSASSSKATASTSKGKARHHEDDDDDDDGNSDDDDNDDDDDDGNSNTRKRQKTADVTPTKYTKKFNALVSKLRSFKDGRFIDFATDKGTSIITNTSTILLLLII